MTGYAITFLIMLAVFMVGCFAFKLPVGVSMLREMIALHVDPTMEIRVCLVD